MAERITDKLVRELSGPASGNRVTYDSDVKGFGVRVTAAGAKSFVLNYRTAGRERRLTIGAYPAWSVEAARREAKALRQRIDKGEDPMGDRHAKRTAPTVADLCDRYLAEHLPRKRPLSQRDDKWNIRTIIRPRLGKAKVGDLRVEDVDRLHQSMKATPYRANRVLALLSKMLSLAARWGWIEGNPCKHVDRFHEERRERYLTGDERARLLVAMQAHAEKSALNRQTVTILRLAMLTGARIGEVLSARWEDFDLEAGVWTKPSARTKTRRTHRVPLNAAARSLLSEWEETTGGNQWVFPAPAGVGHQRHYKDAWEAIRQAAGVPDLRVHDLRHSFASEGAAAGLSLPMIGALLGHTSPQTTARYAHLMDDPLRVATDKIGARLTAAPKPSKSRQRAG